MIREVDLASYMPQFMQHYKEPKAVLEAQDPEFILIWEATERILYNRFISTADIYGISRFERLLGIFPSSDDTLESRRSRVASKWFSSLPYTIRMLVQQLIILCGEESDFTISNDFDVGYTLSLVTNLQRYGQVEELRRIIRTMLPENIVLDSQNDITIIAKGFIRLASTVIQTTTYMVTNDFNSIYHIEGSSLFGSTLIQVESKLITNDFNSIYMASGQSKIGTSMVTVNEHLITNDYDAVVSVQGPVNAASTSVIVTEIKI